MLGFFRKKPEMYDVLYGAYRQAQDAAAAVTAPEPESAPVEASSGFGGGGRDRGVQYGWDDGSKFAGGFGATQLLTADYWTLRARSSELFERNLYARGLIRRLVTNEINTGLHLEALPSEKILGFKEEELAEWTEDVENRFELWGNNDDLCDYYGRETFGELQAAARTEALVAGDVLVVLQQDPRTGLPSVRLVSGSAVQTPLGGKASGGNKIVHGVEIDALGRHVAFWISQESKDGSGFRESKRLPAYGEKTGRRLAWLVYGTEKRLDDVRGKPILSLVLQSLKEIDRYRDSVQRKATLNSMVAMFIQKDEAAPGTTPFGKAAIKKSLDTTGTDTGPRVFRSGDLNPGIIFDELQHGEKPVGFHNQGTDEKFRDFEEAILATIAWAHGVPPETLTLAFSNNYSASQAATNEFKMYLEEVRTKFGFAFCQRIYVEWLVSSVLKSKIEAARLVEARRDPAQHEIFGAWTAADWSGQIKPAIDQLKLVRALTEAVDNGFMTRAKATRELNGTKYSRNVQILERENGQLVGANSALEAMKNPAPPAPVDPGTAEEADAQDAADTAAKGSKKAKSN
jgi:lambda family phage portal protein